ncbi:MAG TPA: metalloregulator ArsR/SmtB family transcription factor [Clostridiaceae bacterium]|nr:metalloregulator ArsR/SmtB family transcription factor [Clostridiaceae bacterium]
MDNNMEKLERPSEILRVLGHPVRLCIVNGLIRENGCNVSFIQECLEIPQSTISQHIKSLKSAGIIEGVRKGTEITYRVKDKLAIEMIKLLNLEGNNE